ncbi:heparin lyase I family protein [Paraglaciecola marina]|uniref:heparin lyase I family protein n=1 Tax=Paraglaciecola marina TaxID=2500157 RepID=UPI00105BBB22|nr:heparin lyase I family protein [Paraglaciecola marina]
MKFLVRFLMAFCMSVNLNASDEKAVNAVIDSYFSMFTESTELKEFLWDGSTVGEVGADTQNWNKLSSQSWGIINISTSSSTPVRPYSDTDPGFIGPNDENYGVEIEFGSEHFLRSAESKSVRFYTDFGQSGLINSGIDRAEIHIRTSLEELNITEGDTIWVGWSEYYTALDKIRSSTIFQFRNQPTQSILEKRGFTDIEVNDLINLGVTDGGPATAVELKSVNGELYFKFGVRDGTTMDWALNNEHLVESPVETGKWYDFIVKLKYSQGEDGIYKIWFYESLDKEHTIYDDPEWDYKGNTMYTYPEGYKYLITSPQFRIGVYRWAAKNDSNMGYNDRYLNKYLGPLRIWLGESDEGFDKVKPR